jgi:hypothetical protein
MFDERSAKMLELRIVPRLVVRFDLMLDPKLDPRLDLMFDQRLEPKLDLRFCGRFELMFIWRLWLRLSSFRTFFFVIFRSFSVLV